MGATALLFQGQRHLRAGEAERALEALDRAAERDPESPHVTLHRALALADTGRLGDALALLEHGASQWPENAVFPLFRGALLAEAGRLDEARAALGAARQLSPGNLLAEAYLALAALRRGDVAGPLQHLAAVGMSDNPRVLAAILAEVEVELFRRLGPHTDGKPPAAPAPSPDERLRRLRAPRLLALGRARLERGDPAGAWAALKLAVEKNPSLPDLFANLGFAAYDLGRYEDALDCLDRAGSWASAPEAVLLHRGASLYKLGRLAEALDALEAAEKADSLGDYTVWTQLYLARVLVALGRTSEAVPHLRRLVALEGDTALARLRQARELLGLALPDSAPDGFAVIQEGRTVLVVKPPYADAIRDRRPAPTSDGPLSTVHCPLSTVPAGRALMERIALPDGGTALVRHCRRGGIFGRLLGDKHFDGGRFLREVAVADALRRRGIPTPEIIAGIRREIVPGVYRAEIIVREVPDSLDLAAALRNGSDKWQEASDKCETQQPHPAHSPLSTPHSSLVTRHASRVTRHSALTAAAHLVRRIHDAGLWHPDLNARNILIAADGSALILDLDRAELRDELSLADRVAGLARLYRSLHKLGLAPEPVGDADWAAFYDAYAGDDPVLLAHTDSVLARCRRDLRRHQLWWRVLGGPRS